MQIGGFYLMRLRAPGYFGKKSHLRIVPDFIALFTFTSVSERKVKTKRTDYCKIRIEVFNLLLAAKSSIDLMKTVSIT